MAHIHAYCYSDGVILFGSSVPAGALPIVDGFEGEVQRAIYGSARLSYDGETWLVPGVPEATDQNEGIGALIVYRDRVRISLARLAVEEITALEAPKPRTSTPLMPTEWAYCCPHCGHKTFVSRVEVSGDLDRDGVTYSASDISGEREVSCDGCGVDLAIEPTVVCSAKGDRRRLA